mmetsp:Transcript_26904/g.77967  ORF Transcript_26904/g.77967 Transcript_26904/m.77967 type:complete len:282 (+) Transcript_26904:283-1128(+)
MSCLPPHRPRQRRPRAPLRRSRCARWACPAPSPTRRPSARSAPRRRACRIRRRRRPLHTTRPAMPPLPSQNARRAWLGLPPTPGRPRQGPNARRRTTGMPRRHGPPAHTSHNRGRLRQNPSGTSSSGHARPRRPSAHPGARQCSRRSCHRSHRERRSRRPPPRRNGHNVGGATVPPPSTCLCEGRIAPPPATPRNLRPRRRSRRLRPRGPRPRSRRGAVTWATHYTTPSRLCRSARPSRTGSRDGRSLLAHTGGPATQQLRAGRGGLTWRRHRRTTIRRTG